MAERETRQQALPPAPIAPDLKIKPPNPLALATSRHADMDVKTEQPKSKWNTKNLGMRLGADLFSAACAGTLVAPIVSIIDRSIMENASGRRSLGECVKSCLRELLLRPHHVVFSKPFALIFALYGGTYLTANTLDTAVSTIQNRSPSHVTAGTEKFAASSAANIGICMYKDQVFVRMFGPPGVVPRAVPMVSYALFGLRDCLTIFASFNVPPRVGPWLNERMGEELRKKVSGLTVVQFAAPAMVQFVSTPLHLLGLDVYNRPNTAATPVSARDRWHTVAKNWGISTMARICRIIPAYGVGGVVNRKVRLSFMDKLE
ncbi:putative membrane protein [Colletotrichum orbiculare MAFF 240422]|uniref:Membrane protein n=2 Tax=Colletotrichum orbiculare species complex TaxID=2707354 RepID=N4VIE2_COLOR|nr:putative membrane protein [Colletotrichum orbiculare MAFF 240422]